MDEAAHRGGERAPRPDAADAGRAPASSRWIPPPPAADAPAEPPPGQRRHLLRQTAVPCRTWRRRPPELDKLLVFRSIHPLYGAFLLDQLGIADRNERMQALESVLEMPRPLLRYVRVPWPDKMPPGPLATTRLDAELIQPRPDARQTGTWRGEETKRTMEDEEEERPPTLAREAAAAVRRPLSRRDRRDRRNRSGPRANCCVSTATSTISCSRAIWSSRRASSSAICCA